MKIILSALLFCISAFAFGEADMSGYWSVKCGGFGGNIQINTSNEVKININDNNLFISAHLGHDKNGVTEIYYQNIIESDNDLIDWEHISRNKPIATISLKDNILDVSWHGLFDSKKGIYVWENQPDFVVATGNRQEIKMQRCNFS
ncbi:MAG TPA: hypothetical protein VGN40_07250 [Lelliottia sp.]